MGEKIINIAGIEVFGSDEERVEAFLEGVKQLQERYDCVLVPEVRFIGERVTSNIVAVAKPRPVIPSYN